MCPIMPLCDIYDFSVILERFQLKESGDTCTNNYLPIQKKKHKFKQLNIINIQWVVKQGISSHLNTTSRSSNFMKYISKQYDLYCDWF